LVFEYIEKSNYLPTKINNNAVKEYNPKGNFKVRD